MFSNQVQKKSGVQLPLKTWWLFLSSVWRPPHSFFRSCRVSCFNSLATSLTERLPEDEEKWWKIRQTKEQEEVFQCYFHQYSAHTASGRHRNYLQNRKTASDKADWFESMSKYRTFYRIEKKNKNTSTRCMSVLVRAVKYENWKSCSSKLSRQRACISPLHLPLAVGEHDSLPSLSHRDSNFRYQRANKGSEG